jgi:hypothetical protein
VLNYENNEVGYMMEVDLVYPEGLHDAHSDYPLGPENMCVTADMVSDFSKNIYTNYHSGAEVNDEQNKKLVLNLKDKENMSFTS